MSFRFILGRAGAGKTHRCVEEMVAELRASAEAPPLIMLVPEQATFLTEQTLIEKVGALVRGEVLSFRRLAWRILTQLGGALRPELNELGRHMALRAILTEQGSQLQLFDRVKDSPGFIRQLATTINELGRYEVTPARLLQEREKRARDGDSLGRKLADLSLIHEHYLDYIEGRFTDPEGVLTLAACQLENSSYLKDALIWVDGFSGFDPQEYHLLGALLARARQINVALCLDPRELDSPLDEGDLFYPTRATYRDLQDLARRRGVSQAPPLLLEGSRPRFGHAQPLEHLEKHMFGRTRVATGIDVEENVQVVAAADRRSEVEAAGRKLIALARDRGYRWRDMAVILRQTETYADIVAAVFDELDIPYFLDKKRSLTHHPLVELVRAVMDLAGGSWSYETVFRALKTDLFPVGRGEVDQLENYVLAYGIKGERWFDGQPWRYFPRFSLDEEEEPGEDDERFLERINEIRQQVVACLLPFYRQVRQGELTVRQVATCLYELVTRLDAPSRLDEWGQVAREGGEVDTAEEHEGAYAAVVGLLDQLVEAVGDRRYSWRDLGSIVHAGLETLTLGMVPPALDQVVVGSIERSRHPQLKAALILGMNEGVFPLRHGEDPVLGDGERAELSALGLDLAPTARRQQFNELYLAYIACTRADRFLYLSYPLADGDGGPLLPSPYLVRIGSMFPQLGLEEVKAQAGRGTRAGLARLTGPRAAVSYLVERLAQREREYPLEPVWLHTYNWLRQNPQGRRDLAVMLASLEYDHELAPLSPEVVRELYGNPLLASVSRMERFAACPLWHYLSYGLSLQERKVQTVTAPEIGSFMHACLSRFAQYLRKRKLSWRRLEPGQAAELMGEVVREVTPRLEGEALLRGEQQRFLARLMERSLVEVVQVMAEQARQSGFDTVATELNFGRGQGLPALSLELGDQCQLQLRGQIDRVDVAESEDGELYLRVVDYKRRGGGVDLTDLYHGLGLQLAVYLTVMEEHAHHFVGQPARPVGLFYQSLERSIESKDGPLDPGEAQRLLRRAYRLQGLLLDEQEVLTLSDAGLATPGFSSDVVPVKVNRDRTAAKHAKVVNEERLRVLLRFARHRMGSLGQRLLDGDIRAYPYRKQQRRACQWCEYGAACGFDVLLRGNEYRQIKKESHEEIWSKMTRAVGGEDDGEREME